MQIGKAAYRPFSPRSIWNIPTPGGASHSAFNNGVWSGVTIYTIGDLVLASTEGSLVESYMYVSLTGGSGKSLPAGPLSNADWQWVAIGMQDWDGGLPLYEALGSDLIWQVGFNANAFTLISDGTWGSMSDNDIWATCTPVMATDYNPYATITADSPGGSPTPPTFGTYHSKGVRNPFPITYSTAPIFMPRDLAVGGANTDWTVVVVQPNGMVFAAFACKVLSGFRLACANYEITNSEQSGDGIQNGFRASMLPGYAGLVTTEDLEFAFAQDTQAVGTTSTEVIPHRIGLLVPKEMLTLSGGPFTYPASAADSQADAANAYSGTKLLCGDILTLDPAASSGAEFGYFFGSDSWMKWPRVLYNTFLQYGFVAVDRGGSGITLLSQLGSGSYDYYEEQALRYLLNYARKTSIASGNYLVSNVNSLVG